MATNDAQVLRLLIGVSLLQEEAARLLVVAKQNRIPYPQLAELQLADALVLLETADLFWLEAYTARAQSTTPLPSCVLKLNRTSHRAGAGLYWTDTLPLTTRQEVRMALDAETARLKWALNQDLVPLGVTLERLRVLATLGCFDTWPEDEHQRVERVLDAFAEMLAYLDGEPHTTDEVVMIQAGIESNLEIIYRFLASDPAYLAEPEFSALLRQTVLASAETGGPVEQHREVGS